MTTISIFVFDDDIEALEDLSGYAEETAREANLRPTITKASDWDEAHKLITDPSRQFDLVVTDTYKDGQGNRKTDDAVTNVLDQIKGKKSIPILLCSTATRPSWFEETAFLVWADKTKPREIREKISQLLKTQIPHILRSVKDEIEHHGGKYIWDFLVSNWESLQKSEARVLERIIRKRLSTLISHSSDEDGVTETQVIDSCEYYHYPPISEGVSLGEIIKKRDNPNEWRVILTPHCYLTLQPGATKPRTDYVLTVKIISASEHTEKWNNGIDNIKNDNNLSNIQKMTTPGGAAKVKKPEGRNWFLPAFLEIPSSYIDFEQAESIPYAKINEDYERVAVLCAPFAESMQQSFASYYSSVGMPNLRTESISEVIAAQEHYKNNQE